MLLYFGLVSKSILCSRAFWVHKKKPWESVFISFAFFLFSFFGCKTEDEGIVILFTVPVYVANPPGVCQAPNFSGGVSLHEDLTSPQYK